jgi:hypothetical protein
MLVEVFRHLMEIMLVRVVVAQVVLDKMPLGVFQVMAV